MGINLSCKEVHRLASEQYDRPLGPWERSRMRLHLVMCHACRNFSGQMAMIRGAMRQLDALDEPGSGKP